MIDKSFLSGKLELATHIFSKSRYELQVQRGDYWYTLQVRIKISYNEIQILFPKMISPFSSQKMYCKFKTITIMLPKSTNIACVGIKQDHVIALKFSTHEKCHLTFKMQKKYKKPIIDINLEISSSPI